MKNKTKILLALTSLVPLALSSCGDKIRETDDLSQAPKFIEKTYFNFLEATPTSGFFVSHLWSNNMQNTDPFGSTWNEKQVSYNSNDGMVLAVNKTDDKSLIRDATGKIRDDFEPYLSAEIRTIEAFTYGFYGTVMKPSAVSSIVSAFFTYTGPSENQPHDEIDIEFLGKDLTQVQFNYYAGNDQPHEYMFKLGFDASNDYHHYGFYWGKNEITWYVDYQPVYRLANITTPSHPSKVFSSCWKVTQLEENRKAWAGELDESKLPTSSKHKSISIADLDGKAINPLPEGANYNN